MPQPGDAPGGQFNTYAPIGTLVDAYGNPVGINQPTYVARINHNSPIAGMPQTGGIPVYAVNPNYQPAPSSTGNSSQATGTQATVTPPHYRITFDAIGQTIYRSIGHCRLPLRTIWAQGINWPGAPEDVTSPTLTFAAALCAPFDPTETGQVQVMLAGSNVIYDVDQGESLYRMGLVSRMQTPSSIHYKMPLYTLATRHNYQHH